MVMELVDVVEDGPLVVVIWYGLLGIVEHWSEKLAAKDCIAAHPSVEIHHFLSTYCNPFCHDLGDRTSSRRQVIFHIGRKSSEGLDHLNQQTGHGRGANQ